MTHAMQKNDRRQSLRPALDIFENADHFLIVADLPGVASNQVELNLEDGELTLVGHRAAPTEGVKLLQGHWADLDYTATLRVPPDVDGSQVQARLDAGVLEITLPKAARAKARQIPVSVG
ncbi:MAG: Hsp20/alpha crystallin family protein [Bradymonadia bacterium]